MPRPIHTSNFNPNFSMHTMLGLIIQPPTPQCGISKPSTYYMGPGNTTHHTMCANRATGTAPAGQAKTGPLVDRTTLVMVINIKKLPTCSTVNIGGCGYKVGVVSKIFRTHI